MRVAAFTVLASAGLLAACGGPKGPSAAVIETCVRGQGVSGGYQVERTETTARVLPGSSVSQANVPLINACIAQTHADMTNPPQPPTAEEQELARLDGFVLQPGDEALWLSLTPDQKARALDFLRNGSTIQSSLKEK